MRPPPSSGSLPIGTDPSRRGRCRPAAGARVHPPARAGPPAGAGHGRSRVRSGRDTPRRSSGACGARRGRARHVARPRRRPHRRDPVVPGRQQVRARQGRHQPISNDQNCPDGCEQPSLPHALRRHQHQRQRSDGPPRRDVQLHPRRVQRDDDPRRPVHQGQRQLRHDLEVVACDSDLDVRESAGTDCAIPLGSSAGNTHALAAASTI